MLKIISLLLLLPASLLAWRSRLLVNARSQRRLGLINKSKLQAATYLPIQALTLDRALELTGEVVISRSNKDVLQSIASMQSTFETKFAGLESTFGTKFDALESSLRKVMQRVNYHDYVLMVASSVVGIIAGLIALSSYYPKARNVLAYLLLNEPLPKSTVVRFFNILRG